MRKLLIIILFCFVFNSIYGQHWTQNKVDTKVEFKIKNIGIYVSGGFSAVEFKSNFNKENLDESYINVLIKVVSINTGNMKRDKHLLKEDFFDIKNYEEIQFTSTKIEKTSTKNFRINGNLTIKNITKSIKIPIEVLESEDSLEIRSNFKINRRDYKVGGNIWVLSNNVKIQVHYKAEKINE